MKYEKIEGVYGSWVKGSEVVSGTKAKLITEVKPQPSQFKDKNGNPKTQDVAKIMFQGFAEEKNINLNRATINGLIDAFGDDSKMWIGKTLTAHTEKVLVGGKRQIAVYLLADGYEAIEDEDGFMKIINPDKQESVKEEINPSEIPF